MTPFVAFDSYDYLWVPFIVRHGESIAPIWALARHFLKEWRGDCVGTLPTPLGVRCFTRDIAPAHYRCHQREGRESADPMTTRSWLRQGTPDREFDGAGRPDCVGTVASYEVISAVSRMLNQLACGSGRLASSVLPHGSLYLNTGQIGIASRCCCLAETATRRKTRLHAA